MENFVPVATKLKKINREKFSTLPSSAGNKEDIIIWRGEGGSFSVAKLKTFLFLILNLFLCHFLGSFANCFKNFLNFLE